MIIKDAVMVTIVNEECLILSMSGMIDTMTLLELAQDMNRIEADKFYIKRLVYVKDVLGVSLKCEDVMYYRTIRPEPEIVIKSALCAFNDFQYGMARMFQAVIESDKRIMEIFKDIESAAQWLDVDVDLLRNQSV